MWDGLFAFMWKFKRQIHGIYEGNNNYPVMHSSVGVIVISNWWPGCRDRDPPLWPVKSVAEELVVLCVRSRPTVIYWERCAECLFPIQLTSYGCVIERMKYRALCFPLWYHERWLYLRWKLINFLYVSIMNPGSL